MPVDTINRTTELIKKKEISIVETFRRALAYAMETKDFHKLRDVVKSISDVFSKQMVPVINSRANEISLQKKAQQVEHIDAIDKTMNRFLAEENDQQAEKIYYVLIDQLNALLNLIRSE